MTEADSMNLIHSHKNSNNNGKLQVSISDEGFEAGRLNTVSIVISNPFDTAIEILDIQSPQSTHLKRKDIVSNKTYEDTGDLEIRPKKPTSRVITQAEGLPVDKSGLMSRMWRHLADILPSIGGVVLGTAIFGGVSAKLSTENKSRLTLHAEEGSEIEFKQSVDQFSRIDLYAAKDAKVVIGAEELDTINDSAHSDFDAVTNRKPLHTLEPHCELVAYIPLLTSGWMFFKPIRMNLTYLVSYRMVGDKRLLTQVVSSPLDIRPPLRSVVIGSMLGAALGTAAKYAQHIGQAGKFSAADLITNAPLQIVQLIGATIMAIIAAVALSRKTGAQSFITVEDFFGGFVVGVLIGYQGTAYFENILNRVGHTTGSAP